MLIAIDPGTTQSAYVEFNGEKVLRRGILPNEELETLLRSNAKWTSYTEQNAVACEMIASYGMPVGKEVFETVFWIGRFSVVSGHPFHRLYRLDIKTHLCKSARAKDGNVRQALIDRFGGKDAAIGKKAKPGPLFGVSSHLWSALAVAVTFFDKQQGA